MAVSIVFFILLIYLNDYYVGTTIRIYGIIVSRTTFITLFSEFD